MNPEQNLQTNLLRKETGLGTVVWSKKLQKLIIWMQDPAKKTTKVKLKP